MIETLRIKDFKSFSEVEFQISPLTLLVGTNASGKSNLRDAFRVLHGIGLGYSLSEILGEKYGPGGILQWRGIRGGAVEAARYGHSRFELEVVLRVESRPIEGACTYTLGIQLDGRHTGPRVACERFMEGKETIFDSNPTDILLRQSSSHQIRVFVRHHRARMRHGQTFEFSSTRPVLHQMTDRGDQSDLTRLKCRRMVEVLQSIRFLDLDPDAMRSPSIPGQLILGDRGENLSSVLQAICADEGKKQTLLSWLRALTPLDAADLDFATDLSGKVLLQLEEANGAKLSAASASDGTLRFLALTAALLSPDSGRIYFFEELENGIHPTCLHLLLQLLQRACDQQGVQVIGTTHNPALLAFLDERARKGALLVYRPEGQSDSRIRPIADLPNIGRLLKNQDLGSLHASGWLEDAAIFSEPDEVVDRSKEAQS